MNTASDCLLLQHVRFKPTMLQMLRCRQWQRRIVFKKRSVNAAVTDRLCSCFDPWEKIMKSSTEARFSRVWVSPRPGLRSPSVLLDFRTGTGTLRCLQKGMATYRHWSVSLWRDPDDVSHCRILSPDKTEWRLISATLCGWRHCFVADQLCFTTRIREEED